MNRKSKRSEMIRKERKNLSEKKYSNFLVYIYQKATSCFTPDSLPPFMRVASALDIPRKVLSKREREKSTRNSEKNSL